jgi:hypothetical protein
MDEQDIGWGNGSADEDFGSEVGQMWLNFVPSPNHKSNQHDPRGPDYPL